MQNLQKKIDLERPDVPIHVKKCSGCGNDHKIDRLTKASEIVKGRVIVVWFYQCPEVDEAVFVLKTDYDE